MPVSNYPHGFSSGVTIRGVPLVQAFPGKVFWVNNSTVLPEGGISGSDGNPGTYLKPFSTLDYAIGQCTANRGDIIMVMPGHAETVTSTSIAADVAGIAIVGLGAGTKRPTFTYSSATATITVSAANIAIKNLLFVANFADVATYFTNTTAKDFAVEDCEFRDTASNKNALSVITTNSTANASDGLWFHKNHVTALGTTAATTAIIVAAAIDRVTVTESFFNYAVLNNTATIIAGGANNMTNVKVGKNIVVRPNTDTATGGLLITSSSTACTGMVYDNYARHLDTAAALIASTGTKLGFTNNLLSGEADKSGFVLPAIADDA